MYREAGDKDEKPRRAGWMVALVLLCAAAASAQMELADNLKLNLNGTLGLGYGGGFGTFGNSNHNMSLNGNAGLTGSYYHPNFLNFNLQPYYNRSQSNSDMQSIFDASGFTGGVNFFSGSRFPGSIGFSKAFNSSGEFGIPGQAGLTTNGSAQGFNIAWGAFLPNLPTLSAEFSSGSNSSSVLGATGDSKASNRNFNLNSHHTLAGFQMNAFYAHQTADMSFPTFLGTGESVTASTSSTYGVSANHSMPMSGNFGVNWNRTTYGSEDGTSNDGSSNNLTALATFTPVQRVTMTADFRYVDNLVEVLRQIAFTEATPALLAMDNASHSFVFGTSAYVRVGHGFGLQGRISHREQLFQGQHIGDTQYGGIVNYNYARPLFGMLYFSFGMVDTANELGNSSLGFNANTGISRRFGRWETGADFSYAQNVQTLVALYTTSSYSYGGSVRRKLNYDTYWNAAYRSTRSGFAQIAGSNNHSQTVTTGLSWKGYGASYSYSDSAGVSVLTSNGLVAAPTANLFTNDVLLFNGSGYGVTVSATPIRRMQIAASYNSVRSETKAGSVFSLNRNERYYARLDYRMRKLLFRAGYTRAWQGISASGAPASVVNSYYFGVSRWFQIF